MQMSFPEDKLEMMNFLKKSKIRRYIQTSQHCIKNSVSRLEIS